jgi:hypothetical protein
MIFYNAGGTTVTFTIKLDEPDEYDALGITFADKVITVAGGEKHLLPVDSRYRTASDGMIYVECNTATNCKLQITKRYTIV